MLSPILTVGAVALTLGACATENRTIVVSEGAHDVQLMKEARAVCQAYGITPYTERFERCVQNEYASRVAS